MFFACGIWCVADVSSVSPSLEQIKFNVNFNSFFRRLI